MIYNCGLVLEGGGMRGVYTAGILDYFLEKGIDFREIYGVSAGCINAINYKSKQKGRTRDVFMKYRNDERYCSVNSLLKTGNYFNVDFSYNVLPNELELFDYETFAENPVILHSVIRNLVTGKAEYPIVTDGRAQMDTIRASASLPLISLPVEIDGVPYLDGGISDSVPLEQSQKDGNKRNVVILTQHRGFVKQPSGNTQMVKMMYRKYPEFIKANTDRHIMYNRQTAYVYEQEKLGDTFVIQPRKPVDMGRMESDISKLYEWYAYGRQDAKACYDELMKFLSEC